ncbi:hypothetical protein [Paraburkholderia terrae]
MVLARGALGFSGAELAHLVNEAALLAARCDHPHVTSVDFEQARDRVMTGAERRSLTTTSEEREMTAGTRAGRATYRTGILCITLVSCPGVALLG